MHFPTGLKRVNYTPFQQLDGKDVLNQMLPDVYGVFSKRIHNVA